MLRRKLFPSLDPYWQGTIKKSLVVHWVLALHVYVRWYRVNTYLRGWPEIFSHFLALSLGCWTSEGLLSFAIYGSPMNWVLHFLLHLSRKPAIQNDGICFCLLLLPNRKLSVEETIRALKTLECLRLKTPTVVYLPWNRNCHVNEIWYSFWEFIEYKAGQPGEYRKGLSSSYVTE